MTKCVTFSVWCAGLLAALATPSSFADAAGSFTYAHWNIGHFSVGAASNPTIEPAVAEAKAKEYRTWMDIGADWFGISEYDAAFTKDGSVKTAPALFGAYDLQNVGPDCSYQWNAQFGKSGRFTVLESRTVPYQEHQQKTYYLAQRVLIDGATEAWIVQTHFDWKPPFYEAQLKQLVDDFKACPRVIISGDFNFPVLDGRRDSRWWFARFRAAGYDLALDDFWQMPGTFKPDGSGACRFLDNILVKGFEITAPGVVVDGDRTMSDHFIVHCRLTPTPDAHTHAYGPWKVVKDPTVTAAGERVRTCTAEGCAHAERRPMEPLAYAWLETGGSACVATDYVPDLEKTFVEMTFQVLSLRRPEVRTLFWADAAGDGRSEDLPVWGARWMPGDGKPHIACAAGQAETVLAEGFSDTKDFHTIVFGGDRAALDGKRFVCTEAPAQGKAGGQLILGAQWAPRTEYPQSGVTNSVRMRIKSVKIWEKDGASRKLVHRYVPARNGTEATLYDTVAKRYLRALGRTQLPSVEKLDLTGYSITWRDEFNGEDIDWSHWESPSMERQGASLWDKRNVSVRDGAAVFKIRKTDDPKLRYESACLRTATGYKPADRLYAFSYGYIEARCKVQRHVRSDYWFAVWLMVDDVVKGTSTRDGCEIDIMETFYLGCNGQLPHTIHWGGYGEHHNALSHTSYPPAILDNDWHTYGCLRTPTELVFTVDGYVTWRTDLMNGGADEPGKAKSNGVPAGPGYIKLSAEAARWAGPHGGSWEEPMPEEDEALVDWVRVWEKTDK